MNLPDPKNNVAEATTIKEAINVFEFIFDEPE